MPKGERGTSRPYRRGKIWWIRYTVPGEAKERFESSKSPNKADAVKLLNKRRREIDEKTVVPAHAMIGNLLDLYLADRKKGKGYRDAETYVRLHLRPAFGKVKVGNVTTSMVENFIAQKKALGRANASINRWLEGLHRAFTLGFEHKPRLVSEVPRIAMLDESDNVREGLLSHRDYVKVREELPAHQKPLLIVGYHLGMRRGEILRLRWDQVDWQANLIRLEKRQTKGKQARNAPLYGELRAFLDMAYADPERGETIVSWKGVKISDTKRAWRGACKRAGVPHLLVHDLRRTAVSNMINGAGIPEKTAMLISGHKTRSILDRYSIVVEKDIHTAGRRMEAYLAEQEKVRTKVRTVESAAISPGLLN
jgi:site-specific recombinase XerC